MATFDWNKFYDVGNHLKEYSDNEEYQRSAIGRYYYACFNLSKNYFEEKYYPLGHNNVHITLIKCLKNSNSEYESELSDCLNKLRRYRNNADYDSKFHENNIIKTENTVNEIFNIFKKLE
ncbi:hypothetical protein [Methanobrevibacter boviskoreani]|uniref:hypothetical protein n=1 Tax=Methanobrevibacter boviskoreani TaxID=1348249 RepID=UPI0006ACDB8A|nr:hypothetical protein [Methanobrevibacter boviskoreani]